MPTTPNKNYSIPDKGTKNWHVDLNANWTAIDLDIDGFDDDKGEFNTETNLVAGAHNAVQPATAAGKVSLEVQDARGSHTSLDGRLSVGIADDGTIDASAFVFAEFITSGLAGATWVSASTLTFTGDVRAILLPGMPLELDFTTSGKLYFFVRKVTYPGSGNSTVTVWEGDNAMPNEVIVTAKTSGFAPAIFANATGKIGASSIVPGALASFINFMRTAGIESIARYDSVTFNTPFAGGPTVQESNTGQVALIRFGSGLTVAFYYASAGGLLTKMENAIEFDEDSDGTAEDVKIATYTATRDGTSNLVTKLLRTSP